MSLMLKQAFSRDDTVTRCAVYSRFSSDRQSPVSIEDQIRKCREYASRQGWTVLEGHIYADHSVTGTIAERAGLQRLVAAAEQKARAFAGVRLVAVSPCLVVSILTTPGSFQEKLDDLRDFAIARLNHLKELLTNPKAIHEARALLAEQVGKFTLERVEENGALSFKANGNIDFFGQEAFTRVGGAGGRNWTERLPIRFEWLAAAA